jgi:hypothetical protein
VQPYNDVELAKALVLARVLLNYDAGSIPQIDGSGCDD